MILNKLAGIKYKNRFSQYKNAFIHFCEFKNIPLSSDTLESIKMLEKHTRKKYRQLGPINYKEIAERIKRLKNEKLKLSYQTIIATGLRISELEGIIPADCTITAETITLAFIGKGGDKGTVIIQAVEYPELCQKISELIAKTQADRKIFYSAIYLQKKAKELGFRCHDLRRICAILEYKKARKKSEVMRKLRHSNIKTTNIYLNNKIKF